MNLIRNVLFGAPTADDKKIKQTLDLMTKRFETYNRQYFANKLSNWTLEVKDLGERGGLSHLEGFCCWGSKTIFMNVHTPQHRQNAVLIHEMCHASANAAHTKKWFAETERARKLGGPKLLRQMDYHCVLDEQANLEIAAEELQNSKFKNASLEEILKAQDNDEDLALFNDGMCPSDSPDCNCDRHSFQQMKRVQSKLFRKKSK